MGQELSKEIISAEIVFSNRNLANQVSLSQDYQNQLNDINQQLERYVNHADTFDYTIAVASGILCGVFDSQIAKTAKMIFQADEIKSPSGETIKKVEPLQKQATKKAREILKTSMEDLMKHKGETSMAGMAAAALGGCEAKDISGKILTADEESGEQEIDPGKILENFGPVIFIGLIKCLTEERTPEEIEESDLPKALKKLLQMLNENPGARKILREFDIKKFKLEDLEEFGVPAIFVDIVKRLDPNVDKKIKGAYKKTAKKARSWLKGLPKIKLNALASIGNQAISVLLNEILVRGFYFIRHFTEAYAECGDIEAIDWGKVIPLNNRTIVRMMSIASLTFTTADMADAAIRTAVEIEADGPVALPKYFTRVNVVGVGRAGIAVFKDVSMEWEEAELIRQRRILAEQFRDEQVEALLEFRRSMEEAVELYLAEDLEAFLTGSDEIEEGLRINDSNRVICGNVKIQRILGREPQFTNQDEFDSLMSGEDALIL